MNGDYMAFEQDPAYKSKLMVTHQEIILNVSDELVFLTLSIT